MRRFNGKLWLRLLIAGVAMLLGVTLLLGLPKHAQAADPVVQLEFFDEEHGDKLILIGTSLTGDEQIESCGEKYTVTWAAEPDGRMKTSFKPQNSCDSATVVTGWAKEFVDSSTNWKSESGFLIREFWPKVEVTFSDSEEGNALLLVATNLNGDEPYEYCGKTWPVTWEDYGDGRKWIELAFDVNCDSATIVTSLEKVFIDQSSNWNEKDGYVIRVGWPTVEIEVQEKDGGDTVIILADYILAADHIESCGNQYEVQWTQEPNGERTIAEFMPKSGCGSFTVITTWPKVFVDSSPSWDPQDGYMLRKVWPIAQIEVFDQEQGDQLVFIGTNLIGTEKIESCGNSSDVTWFQEPDGRMKALFTPTGNCDSATVITSLQKEWIDSSTNWKVFQGFVVREFWPTKPITPTVPTTPTVPLTATIEFFDEDNGATLVFIGSNLDGSEKIESCGVNYDSAWTLEEDGRYKASFIPMGTCDSATVVTKLEKSFIDSSSNWGVKDGFAVREVTLNAVIEFFDEDQGATLVFFGEGLTGNEEIESCGNNYSVTWTLEEDGRYKASFSPEGTCESATIVTDLVKEWIDSSEFWSETEGFVVKDIVVDPNPEFFYDLLLPYVQR